MQTLIIDNFVDDKQLLQKISKKPTNDIFWENHPGQWWDGQTSPRSLREKLINHIWNNCPLQFKDLTFAGFEHWAGIHSVGYNEHEDYCLSPHFDKDEGLWEKVGDIVTPILGMIYYPVPHIVEGGHLKIWEIFPSDKVAEAFQNMYNDLIKFGISPEAFSDMKDEVRNSLLEDSLSDITDREIQRETTECELVEPRFNRLVIFDSSKLHAIEKLLKGLRYAVVINIWKENLV